MFGIGLAIQHQSAIRLGNPWPGDYKWRALLLFIDGVIHYLLVAEFDVLMGYALTSFIVSWMLITGDVTRRRLMVSAIVVHVLLVLIPLTAMIATMDHVASGPLDPNPYRDGSFWQLLEYRIEHLLAFRWEVILIIPLTVGLFLGGARLLAAGVLDSSGRALRTRLVWVGLGVALPLDIAIGLWGGDAGLVFARYGTAPVVALGLLAMVAEFYVHRSHLGLAGRRLSEVGRMALSCYVMQNIIASTLCYGWGFGLASRLSDESRVPATIGLYLLVCALIMVFAHAWLQRFQRGPLELLWQLAHQRAVRVSTLLRP